MAWCGQAISHYLRQGWPRSIPPYGVILPQKVKWNAGFQGTFVHNEIQKGQAWHVKICELVQPWPLAVQSDAIITLTTNTILSTAIYWLTQSTDQTMNWQSPPHTSPSWVSYGVHFEYFSEYYVIIVLYYILCNNWVQTDIWSQHLAGVQCLQPGRLDSSCGKVSQFIYSRCWQQRNIADPYSMPGINYICQSQVYLRAK